MSHWRSVGRIHNHRWKIQHQHPHHHQQQQSYYNHHLNNPLHEISPIDLLTATILSMPLPIDSISITTSNRSNTNYNRDSNDNNSPAAEINSSFTLLSPPGNSSSSLPTSSLINWIRPQLTVLWCYLSWWLIIVSYYSYYNNHQKIWLNALAISAVVGVALNINSYNVKICKCSFPVYLYNNPFSTLRFFLIPFCVSSYSAIISYEDSFLFIPLDTPIVFIAIAGIIWIALIQFSVWYSYKLFYPNIEPNLNIPTINSHIVDVDNSQYINNNTQHLAIQAPNQSSNDFVTTIENIGKFRKGEREEILPILDR